MKYAIVYSDNHVDFANYSQLVNYLIKHKTCRSIASLRFNRQHDPILNRVQITGKDTRRAIVDTHYRFFTSIGSIPVHEYGYILRDIQIVDEFGNNAFNQQLIDDINNYEFREDIYKDWTKYICHNTSKRGWNNILVEFRKEPVPGTGHYSRSKWYRHPRTTQEKKYSLDPEYGEFFRKSRGKHLPSEWDDLYRTKNGDISWKNCTKNRHQWENKIKCHNKHIDVYRPVEVIEDDDIE